MLNLQDEQPHSVPIDEVPLERRSRLLKDALKKNPDATSYYTITTIWGGVANRAQRVAKTEKLPLAALR
jgi:hypothetical protein